MVTDKYKLCNCWTWKRRHNFEFHFLAWQLIMNEIIKQVSKFNLKIKRLLERSNFKKVRTFKCYISIFTKIKILQFNTLWIAFLKRLLKISNYCNNKDIKFTSFHKMFTSKIYLSSEHLKYILWYNDVAKSYLTIQD